MNEVSAELRHTVVKRSPIKLIYKLVSIIVIIILVSLAGWYLAEFSTDLKIQTLEDMIKDQREHLSEYELCNSVGYSGVVVKTYLDQKVVPRYHLGDRVLIECEYMQVMNGSLRSISEWVEIYRNNSILDNYKSIYLSESDYARTRGFDSVEQLRLYYQNPRQECEEAWTMFVHFRQRENIEYQQFWYNRYNSLGCGE